jgi:hypothetical protein
LFNRDSLRVEHLTKTLLVAIRGNQCELCQSNNQVSMHHKNGDAKDNRLRNLMLLCNQCHKSIHENEKFNNYKIIGYKKGLFGTRIIYQKPKKEKYGKPKSQNPKTHKRFFRHR